MVFHFWEFYSNFGNFIPILGILFQLNNLFRLTIRDRNDNKPIFPNQEVLIEISESAQIGDTWRLESATDKDPDNGIERYWNFLEFFKIF